MPVRKLLWMIVLAVGLAGCQTLSGGSSSSVAQVQDHKFASDDEFRIWFAYYYKDPHPELLTAGIHYMQEQRYLAEFPDVASVFLSRIFAKQPDALEGWTKSWANLGTEEWNVILVGLWMVNTDQARALAKANVNHVPDERRQQILEMLTHDPGEIDPLTADVIDPRQINMLWAAFSATGDEHYVHQVISYIHLYGDEADPRQHVIGEAALMSLANNTLQHDLVASVCTQEDRSNPDPKTRQLLKAMLNALAQLKDRQGGEQLPAH